MPHRAVTRDRSVSPFRVRRPQSSGTVAEANKFHDDKSLYTGVHANGGPCTKDNTITLSTLMDRSPADVRGRKAGDVAGANPGP